MIFPVYSYGYGMVYGSELPLSECQGQIIAKNIESNKALEE